MESRKSGPWARSTFPYLPSRQPRWVGKLLPRPSFLLLHPLLLLLRGGGGRKGERCGILSPAATPSPRQAAAAAAAVAVAVAVAAAAER